MSVSEAVVMHAAETLMNAADDDSTLVSDIVLQAILGSAVRAYVARVERGGSLPPFLPNTATATDVVVIATAMLEAVGVGVFELSMWRAVKGRADF